MNAKLILHLFSFLSVVVYVAQQNLRRAFKPANVVNKIPYGAMPQPVIMYNQMTPTSTIKYMVTGNPLCCCMVVYWVLLLRWQILLTV